MHAQFHSASLLGPPGWPSESCPTLARKISFPPVTATAISYHDIQPFGFVVILTEIERFATA